MRPAQTMVVNTLPVAAAGGITGAGTSMTRESITTPLALAAAPIGQGSTQQVVQVVTPVDASRC